MIKILQNIILSIITIFIASGIMAQSQNPQLTQEHALTSVMSSGTWYKIKIYNDGIYKLTYEDLIGMGFSNPANIRLFGNGGDMLPLMNNVPRYDDLVENAIYMNKGTDDIFNAGDFILFYGKGPVKWTYNEVTGIFEHEIHSYSSAAYYFLTTSVGTGLKIATSPALADPADITVSEFDDYAYHERNMRNLLKSGMQWFGERIDYVTYDTTFEFPNLITSAPVKAKLNVASRSSNLKTFTFRNNTIVLGYIDVPAVVLSNTTGTYANQQSGQYSFTVSGSQVNLNVSYNKTLSSDQGFLDYIIVNVRRNIVFTGNALFFRDHSVAGTGVIAEYSIGNCNSNIDIWDITNRHEIKKMTSELTGSVLTFRDSTNIFKQYVAVNTDGSFPKPEINSQLSDVGFVANQNIHASAPVQMLIVSHPQFMEAADSLAELHRQKDYMSVLVVSTDQVYNEFSSGAPDVSAIRDLAVMLYNRATGDADRLKYLLLLGDGSYNNISRESGNSNFILTYQSENSLNAAASYVSDDFFGYMQENEGGSDNMGDYSLDLAIGRIPAKTAEEAMAVYFKIKNYGSEKTMADWRNNILFTADDEDGNLHMAQSNNLADWVQNNYPQFNVKKVMLDAYQQVSTSTGSRYPEVNRIISDNFNKGLLIFNYTGHGGERYLAAERILLDEDLETFTNFNNLPLLVTATCEFSRFDDLTDNDGILIENTSAGEYSLLNPNGGSIGLFTTTRIVYSNQNHYLNTKFFEVVFERDADQNYLKLGEVIRMAKNLSGTNRNKLNFILLGDPALSLAIPDYNVITDSLNGVAVSEPIDSLKAFSYIKISGHLENADADILSDYNGILYPSVYDKSKIVTTLANDGGDPMQFTVRENLIFKGKVSVSNGYFMFDFKVPKDITYDFGNGKIVYYAKDSAKDGSGYFSDFIIGGTDNTVIPDLTGPDISLFMNDEYFNNQGITNTSPVIYALISDESGINTVGNGIGHDITGVIDGDVSSPAILNEYFEAALDDYTSGIIQYPMKNLTEGWHSLKIKVWDIFNNSSEKTIEFNVLAGDEVIMAKAYNYPNPASYETAFVFEHNQAGEQLQVSISIFDMQGRLVNIMQYSTTSDGFHSPPLIWNLKDQQGMLIRQGVYPYKIRIIREDGSFTEDYQKLIILRQ